MQAWYTGCMITCFFFYKKKVKLASALRKYLHRVKTSIVRRGSTGTLGGEGEANA